MTYLIALPCVDVKDRTYVDEGPVDGIYEGERMLCIHPDEGVECGPANQFVRWRRSFIKTTRPTNGLTTMTPMLSSLTIWSTLCRCQGRKHLQGPPVSCTTVITEHRTNATSNGTDPI